MKAYRNSLTLVALVSSILLAGCDNTELRTLAADNARLKAELQRSSDDSKKRLDKAIADIKSENSKLQDEAKASDAAVDEVEKLNQKIDSFEDQLKAKDEKYELLQEAFEAYKGEYRASIRSRSRGESLGDIVYQGTKLLEVKISKIDDQGISVLHSKGVERLYFDHLDQDMREKYAYDANLAEEAKIGEEIGQQQFSEQQKILAEKKQAKFSEQWQNREDGMAKRKVQSLATEIAKVRVRLKNVSRELSDVQYKKRYSSSKIVTTSTSETSLKKTKAELQTWRAKACVELDRLERQTGIDSGVPTEHYYNSPTY